MTFDEFIRSYHSRLICPVFHRPSCDVELARHIQGYSSGDSEALEHYAAQHGFRVVRKDYDHTIKFEPLNPPDGFDDWAEEKVSTE